MPRIAVVGYGYWGPNIVRNFFEADGAELAAVCDLRPACLGQVKKRFPQVHTTTSFDEILDDATIDAVAVITPVSTHAELSIRALEAGKHVLVTKPICDSSEDALRVVETAEATGRVLLVDHTFVYMGAVQKVRDLVEAGELGELYYYDSSRVNLGLVQPDVNVLWDLAVHDLSILGHWVDERPVAVSCAGSRHLEGHPEDVAFLTLFYESNFIAHIHVNWLSPVKVRRTLLGGDRKMVVFDDLDPVEKIKLYDRGVTRREDMVGSGQIPIAYRRTGDIWMPQFDMTEALKREADHFIRCITEGEEPRTTGRQALEIIRILEAAEESIRMHGSPVDIRQTVEEK